jgi:hypothetical protein
LDNEFRDPDIDRYLERFEEYDPAVAVIGDAYSREEAEQLDEIAQELLEEHPYKEIIVVPKSEQAFEPLSDDLTLGVPVGYSDIQAEDLGWHRYRGRDAHLLGGAPDKAYDAIQKLTQPNLNGDSPANVVGLDWNGFHKVAFLGEYWSSEGWKPADHLSIRETVRNSLQEIKGYWQEKGVWPDTEPCELYGSAVEEPDELIFMDRGGDPIGGQEELEHAYVQEYEDYGKLAFESDHRRKHWEYFEDLTPV